jgi:hypothetical protein
MEALDYYEAQGKADKAQLADVRRWLESYPFDDHIDMEERNALLEAIAESEKEEAQGIYYTTEQVQAELNVFLEELEQDETVQTR